MDIEKINELSSSKSTGPCTAASPQTFWASG